MVAQERGDLEEAVLRWRNVRKRHPTSWKCYNHETICLRSLGRLEEADALISRGTGKCSESLFVAIEWARTAEARSDLAAIEQRWRSVWDRFGWVGAAIGLSRALRRLGRSEEALDTLLAVKARFPRDSDLRAELKRFEKDIEEREKPFPTQ